MASQRHITVGGVQVGGGAPVVVQSMTTAFTWDVDAVMSEVDRMVGAGCELVRVAVPGRRDVEALPQIVARCPVPVIADIHFNASLAVKAMDTGVAAVRINPGNIGASEAVQRVVEKARATGTPLRIGANAGSLPEHLREYATADPVGALVDAALEEIRLLERMQFTDFKVSVKSSSVPVMVGAYRRLAATVPYPLHLGVTEAG